jgi:hypothetical protein
VEGIEPQEEFRDLTHEKVQNSLKTFLKECARKTGMEKTFAVRRRIRGIRYSRGTVTVDFGWENPPDGKTGTEWESSAPALRAGGGDSSGFAPKTKRPDSFGKSGPFGQFVSEKMSRDSLLSRTVPLSFPNIAHDYWDNYRLTKEFYIRPDKPSTK